MIVFPLKYFEKIPVLYTEIGLFSLGLSNLTRGSQWMSSLAKQVANQMHYSPCHMASGLHSSSMLAFTIQPLFNISYPGYCRNKKHWHFQYVKQFKLYSCAALILWSSTGGQFRDFLVDLQEKSCFKKSFLSQTKLALYSIILYSTNIIIPVTLLLFSLLICERITGLYPNCLSLLFILSQSACSIYEKDVDANHHLPI